MYRVLQHEARQQRKPTARVIREKLQAKLREEAVWQ
jgi:hypothetical protein